MPEKAFSGKAFVICAILASESGRIAGPPRPPVATNPSTSISNSSVSGSISGSDVNVFDEEIASAPPRKAARASTTMSVVEGVSLAQTGTFATSLTICVTTEISSRSLPMFEPMSCRSMCGQERFSSKASAPSSWQAFASVCQWESSVSFPEPAMMEATSTRSGNAFLMRPMRGTHQSSGLSEISSQFQEECSAVPGRFFMEIVGESTSERRNFVLGPRTLTTGCSQIVLVTTPPQPASKARRMLDSDSVGGAEESKNGFSSLIPVKTIDRSALMEPPFEVSCEKGNSTPRRPLEESDRRPAVRLTPGRSCGRGGGARARRQFGLVFSFRLKTGGSMTESAVVSEKTQTAGAEVETLRNYIGGRWVESRTREFLDVYNPARGEVIA